eukprot:11475511-Heterocapsa_arctica.AAC.1
MTVHFTPLRTTMLLRDDASRRDQRRCATPFSAARCGFLPTFGQGRADFGHALGEQAGLEL